MNRDNVILCIIAALAYGVLSLALVAGFAVFQGSPIGFILAILAATASYAAQALVVHTQDNEVFELTRMGAVVFAVASVAVSYFG